MDLLHCDTSSSIRTAVITETAVNSEVDNINCKLMLKLFQGSTEINYLDRVFIISLLNYKLPKRKLSNGLANELYEFFMSNSETKL